MAKSCKVATRGARATQSCRFATIERGDDTLSPSLSSQPFFFLTGESITGVTNECDHRRKKKVVDAACLSSTPDLDGGKGEIEGKLGFWERSGAYLAVGFRGVNCEMWCWFSSGGFGPLVADLWMNSIFSA
ncbi:hypothetical protein Sjap_006485 [Stephania japonica]|uniref:Uncharacterized protein n=1 Tax=Stephania japonica TaxID=461633 RepID=A0AAP0K8C4_9MAGN